MPGGEGSEKRFCWLLKAGWMIPRTQPPFQGGTNNCLLVSFSKQMLLANILTESIAASKPNFEGKN